MAGTLQVGRSCVVVCGITVILADAENFGLCHLEMNPLNSLQKQSVHLCTCLKFSTL